jgi:hypothetical protein
MFFSTKSHAAVAAVSSYDFNLDAVNEHSLFPMRIRPITSQRMQDSANTTTRSVYRSFPALASGHSVFLTDTDFEANRIG